jgi:hypothetical protein
MRTDILCIRTPWAFKVHLLKGGYLTPCPSCNLSGDQLIALTPQLVYWLEAEGWFELVGASPSTDIDNL